MEPALSKLGTYRGGAKALARIRAEAREVENDRTLSARKKRQRLDTLATERNQVCNGRGRGGYGGAVKRRLDDVRFDGLIERD